MRMTITRIAKITILSALALSPLAAHATDLGEVATQINRSLDDIPGALSSFAYVGGAMYAVKAFKAFAGSTDRSLGHNRPTLTKAITYFVVAGLLMALPETIKLTAEGSMGQEAQVIDHGY